MIILNDAKVVNFSEISPKMGFGYMESVAKHGIVLMVNARLERPIRTKIFRGEEED